jgi:hypothetical protein
MACHQYPDWALELFGCLRNIIKELPTDTINSFISGLRLPDEGDKAAWDKDRGHTLLNLLEIMISERPEAEFSLVSLRFTAALSLFYHVYWGCRGGHPYLLISLPGKRLHRDVDGFETDPSSNKPVKAKPRRVKSHFSPLQVVFVPTNGPSCKE